MCVRAQRANSCQPIHSVKTGVGPPMSWNFELLALNQPALRRSNRTLRGRPESMKDRLCINNRLTSSCRRVAVWRFDGTGLTGWVRERIRAPLKLCPAKIIGPRVEGLNLEVCYGVPRVGMQDDSTYPLHSWVTDRLPE